MTSNNNISNNAISTKNVTIVRKRSHILLMTPQGIVYVRIVDNDIIKVQLIKKEKK